MPTALAFGGGDAHAGFLFEGCRRRVDVPSLNEIVINDETKPSLKDYNLKVIAQDLAERLISPWFKKEWFVGVIHSLLNLLAQYVPEEVMEFIGKVSDGITDAELKEIEDTLVKIIDDKIDIPKIPDFLEASVFRMVVKQLLALAKSGYSMPPAIQE
jgi:hypothetical protein